MQEKLFLKENTILEPLVDNWCAWPLLIPPASAAMNITNSHVKIMRSFIMAPQVHAAAINNPSMRGGPFIDYDPSKAADIKALLDRTVKEQSPMIELAEAIKSLADMLVQEAKGYTLEPLYQKVPEALKGYVELVYDLNHNPSIRFIEGLLYKSRYYNKASQSIALGTINKDDRPFMFSTPKLETNERLHLNIPFDSKALDELFRMREAPRPYSYIKEVLQLEDRHDQLFSSFLTERAPDRRPEEKPDRLRARYFGHACVLLESRGVSILTDPVISYKYDSEIPRYTFSDLPESIDYVLITHSHSDHFVFETLLQLRHKIKTIVVPKNTSGSLEDPSLKLLLKNIGFDNVVELEEMEEVTIEGGAITSLPFLGEHCDLRIRSKNAYHVRLNDQSLLFAADSSNLELKLYEHIHEVVGDIDTLFLGMECEGAPLSWIYGPLMTRALERKMDQSRRLSGSDFLQALDIVNRLNCRKVYVYAMGQEPWLNHIMALQYTEDSKPIVESNKLIAECRSRGIESERLFGAKDYLV
jgi:L-ascorbate metabolism protein UlaG (beta-lactamase superfamily)